MSTCTNCHAELIPSEEAAGICYACQQDPNRNKPTEKDLERARLRAEDEAEYKRFASIILTTEACPAGLQIERRLEIITAESAFGMNVFRDFFVDVRDFFGGRSHATQNALRSARRQVLTELRREADRINADAVVGVTLNYSEFSDKILFIAAVGTAVKLTR